MTGFSYLTFSPKLLKKPYSQELADQIIKKRQQHPIRSAAHLSTIIKDYYIYKKRNTFIHPATKNINGSPYHRQSRISKILGML